MITIFSIILLKKVIVISFAFHGWDKAAGSEATVGGKILFDWHVLIIIHQEWKSGWMLKIRNGKRSHEGKLLTGLLASPGLLSLISYTTHQCLLRDGTYPSRWGTLTSINNQENGPQAWLQAILMEALSQLRTLLQMTIRCITLTEINNDNKKPSPQNKQTKKPIYK